MPPIERAKGDDSLRAAEPAEEICGRDGGGGGGVLEVDSQCFCSPTRGTSQRCRRVELKWVS